MLGMAANRKTFWYAPFVGAEDTQDEYGNTNGQRAIYGKPVQCKANISAGGGTAVHSVFGVYKDYTHVIGPMKRSCRMDEHAVLWIDTMPMIEPDGTTKTPHDYVVKHVSESLTHKMYAVTGVTVGGECEDA